MKAVITVTGKDSVGIIAKVASACAAYDANILDISQTIVQGYFTMMMIVDTTNLAKPFAEMASDLESEGDALGVQIKCQREEIFEKMHRI